MTFDPLSPGNPNCYLFFVILRFFCIILNQLISFLVNLGTNPGLAAIWEDEQQRRRDANESSQISGPSSQG